MRKPIMCTADFIRTEADLYDKYKHNGNNGIDTAYDLHNLYDRIDRETIRGRAEPELIDAALNAYDAYQTLMQTACRMYTARIRKEREAAQAHSNA